MKSSNACMIFRVRKVRQMFGDPFFKGRDKILLSREALKFGVFFLKIALKFAKIWMIVEKFSEKLENFQENFRFSLFRLNIIF